MWSSSSSSESAPGALAVLMDIFTSTAVLLGVGMVLGVNRSAQTLALQDDD